MNTVKAFIEKEHYKTIIVSGNDKELIADEPLGVGGKNMGFSPGELLCAALASCITVTLRMYADRKEWPLEAADVEVTAVRNTELNITSIKSIVKLKGDLTEEQRSRLMVIADKCSVHKMLTNPITIESQMAVQ
jgi:putative redox protein